MKIINHALVGLSGLISLIYLLNPTAGFVELIPDNLPIIGNLDEAAAAVLLLSCLAYFGLDLTKIFNVKAKDAAKGEKAGKAVIDAEVVKH